MRCIPAFAFCARFTHCLSVLKRDENAQCLSGSREANAAMPTFRAASFPIGVRRRRNAPP
jgi:hypothetical protein